MANSSDSPFFPPLVSNPNRGTRHRKFHSQLTPGLDHPCAHPSVTAWFYNPVGGDGKAWSIDPDVFAVRAVCLISAVITRPSRQDSDGRDRLSRHHPSTKGGFKTQKVLTGVTAALRSGSPHLQRGGISRPLLSLNTPPTHTLLVWPKIRKCKIAA